MPALYLLLFPPARERLPDRLGKENCFLRWSGAKENFSFQVHFRQTPPIEGSEAISGASRERRPGELATLLYAIDERTIEGSAIFKSKGLQMS